MVLPCSWRLLPVLSLLVAAGCGPTQAPTRANDLAAPHGPDMGQPLAAPPDPAPPADAVAPAAGIFAAPNGSGSACSLAAPCSLTGAQAAARAQAAAASGDVVVNLRGG